MLTAGGRRLGARDTGLIMGEEEGRGPGTLG